MKRFLELAFALAFAVVAHAAPGKGTGLSSPVMTNFNKRDFLITLAPGTAPTNIIQLNWGGYTIPNPPASDLPGTTWYIITNYISTNLASTNVLINPTDRYVPYRSNATKFADSPFVVLNTNSVGFNYALQADTFLHHPTRFITALGEGAASATTEASTGAGDAFGTRSLQSLSTGQRNSGFGGASLQATASGNDNTAVGASSGNAMATNSYNTVVGSQALNAGLGDYNTVVGAWANYGYAANKTNRISIGFNVRTTNDNEIVIGNIANTKAIFPITSYTGTGANFLTDDGTYKSASGAGLINPSNDYLPVRSNATTFVDSPLYRVALTNIATDGQIIFGPGMTNVLKRSVSTLQYTNGAADVHFTVLNGSAVGVALEAQSATSVGVETTGSPTVMFLRNGADQAAMVTGQWRPGTDLSLSLGNVTAPRWANVVGTNLYAVSFVDNATNYSRLFIYQPNTNSAFIFDQQTAESAGVSRGFEFMTNGGVALKIAANSGYTGTGTNYLKDDGTFGPVIAASTNSANWAALGSTNSTLTGDAFVHTLLPTNGLQSVAGASATYIGTADIWNMGVNSSSASAIYNNCYSFYNFGTNSAHGIKATNSYSIWNFSLDGLEDAVLDGVANLFGFGADVFWQSQINSGSFNLFGIGGAAGESTLISNSHDLFFFGQSAGIGGSFLNSLEIYLFGNEAGYNLSSSASSEIYAFGGLKNATLANTKKLTTLGRGAGDGINGAYTNVVLIGDGATIGATGENQIIAGPGMNMSLPGTLSAADLLTGGMSVYRGTLTHAGGNVIVDFSPTNRYWSCTITGAVTFVLTNAAAGKWANILLYNTQATNCTPTFNFPVGSKTNWFGGAPSTLTAGTVGSLSYYPTSTDTNATLAAYTETQ